MALPDSLVKTIVNIKDTCVLSYRMETETARSFGETYERSVLKVQVRPRRNRRCLCPKCIQEKRDDCLAKRPGYDRKKDENHPTEWRAADWNGVRIVLEYSPRRISCPVHGVITEYVPWADGESHFTEDFNNEAAYLSLLCPRTVVSQFLSIDWRTVGSCLKAVHNRIEPDVAARLQGLKRICVDETSYSRGHQYITVVFDMDRNQVVWLHKDHGLEVFREFCEQLTEEQRDAIQIVAGDGARWIDDCVRSYFRNATRCVDPFHVTEWINDALDEARMQARRDAAEEATRLTKEFIKAEAETRKQSRTIRDQIEEARAELDQLPRRGRPSARKRELRSYITKLEQGLAEIEASSLPTITEEEYNQARAELDAMPQKKGRPTKRRAYLLSVVEIYEKGTSASSSKLSLAHQKVIDDMKQRARCIKDSKFALGKNPENLTSAQMDKLKLIESSCPQLYEAYRMKEELRTILHMQEAGMAEVTLDNWIAEAAACSIPSFVKMSEKIRRHRQNILNSIRFHMNSSRSEATNCTIKALIATARGFRSLDNMFALIYLRCSDLVIPLNNRYQPSAEKQRAMREIQNARRKAREEMRRQAAV